MGIPPNTPKTPSSTSLNKLTGLTQQYKETAPSSKLDVGAEVVKAQRDLLKDMFSDNRDGFNEITNKLNEILQENWTSESKDKLDETINDNQKLINQTLLNNMKKRESALDLNSLLQEPPLDQTNE